MLQVRGTNQLNTKAVQVSTHLRYYRITSRATQVMYSVYVKAFSDGIKSFILQVEMDASSLNTNDVFVIFTKTQVFIWCGKVNAHKIYDTV